MEEYIAVKQNMRSVKSESTFRALSAELKSIEVDLRDAREKMLKFQAENSLGYLREEGNSADITLVWGVPLIPGGALVTAELANLAVDQCELLDERFTLIGPDNYRQDFLEIKLWDQRGQELARESLYVEEEG